MGLDEFRRKTVHFQHVERVCAENVFCAPLLGFPHRVCVRIDTVDHVLQVCPDRHTAESFADVVRSEMASDAIVWVGPAEPAQVLVLACAEARTRGFKSLRAFTRWCDRHGVVLRRDGKLRWVCPAEIDAAVLARCAVSNDVTNFVEGL